MFTRRTLMGLAAAAVLLGTTSLTMAADKPYIALISKGFQHQFWPSSRGPSRPPKTSTSP